EPDYERVIQDMIRRGYLEQDDSNIRVTMDHAPTIRFLRQLLWPFIDSYWATGRAILSLRLISANKPIEEGMFIRRVQWLIYKLYLEKTTRYLDSASMDTITNAIKYFVGMGIINRTGGIKDDDDVTSG
ncbi:hypothetical protein, partial [Salmonella enterica]|uniref:hypothetical protein n=1 Tax=Salmonella enterica TaxID=28901 RepID=UPI00352ECB98